MSIGNYLEAAILNKVLRNTNFTVTTVYMSLHTADPGETGASELTGGSYARQTTAFNAASNPAGTSQNTAAVTFAAMPAATVTHLGLWDAATSGNFLWGGPLTASKTTTAGDSLQVAPVTLTVTLD